MIQPALPTHSAVFTALTLLLLFGLAVNVSLTRLRHQVFLGDGQVKALQVAIRTHGNALEHVLPMLLLLILYELLGGSKAVVDVLGLVILASRVAHATGYLRRMGQIRRIGVYVTYFAELALPILVMVKALG